MHVTAGIKTRKRNNFAWHSRPRGRVWGEGGSAPPPAMEPSLQLCARLSAYLQDVHSHIHVCFTSDIACGLLS